MWKPLTMRRQIFRIVLLTASAALHVRRAKRGTPSMHPIIGDELRALRRKLRSHG
jgi:hypothetical protein